MGEYLPGAMHERLRELREAHGYSNQGMLADAIGMAESVILSETKPCSV